MGMGGVQSKKMSKGASTKMKLLSDSIDFLESHGIRNCSLREIAEGIGTNHQLLIYHFGSKEKLLQEVFQVSQILEQRGMVAIGSDSGLSAVAELRKFFAILISRKYLKYTQWSFQVYVEYFHDKPFAPFDANVNLNKWVDAFCCFCRRAGVPEDKVDIEGRLLFSVIRGLTLDFLIGRDRATVMSAFDAFIARYDRDGGK